MPSSWLRRRKVNGVRTVVPSRCQNDTVTIGDWWDARIRAYEQKTARETAAARQQGVSAVRGLRELTDDELIAQAPARSSISYPHHEMEMQRVLKGLDRGTDQGDRQGPLVGVLGVGGDRGPDGRACRADNRARAEGVVVLLRDRPGRRVPRVRVLQGTGAWSRRSRAHTGRRAT